LSEVASVLAIAGAIITIGFTANVIFRKAGIPDVLFLIFTGIIFGPLLNIFSPKQLLPLVPVFTALALSLILFHGGLSMKIRSALSQSFRATALAFLYVISATIFVSLFSHFFLEFSWVEALILGPMTAGTSSVIIIPLLSKIGVTEEVKSILSLESVVTDILNIILVMIFLQVYLEGFINMQRAASMLASRFSVGIMIGALIGLFWLKVLDIVKRQEYIYMLTIAAIVLCYSATETLGGSGPLSALVFGLVLGNHGATHVLGIRVDAEAIEKIVENIKSFQGEITFLIRALFLVTLGLIYIPQIHGIIYAGIIVAVNILLRYSSIKALFRGGPLDKYGKFMTLMCGTGLANATLSLLVYNELMQRSAIASLYPLIVTNIIIMNNIITTLAPMILRRKT
jgi:cell volume regulation protein A